MIIETDIQKNLKGVIEESVNWEKLLTEEERTTISYLEAKKRVMDRIYEKAAKKQNTMNKKEAYYLIKKNKKLEEVINHFGDYCILQRGAGKPIKDICDWIEEKQNI